MSKCIGCGVKIQTEDPKKIGYVPEIKLIEDGEEVYCKRCYDIMHHNARYDYSTSTENYYKKISSIKNTNSLIILIVDVLNLNSSFIPNLKDYIGNNKVLVLINKTDILPNTIKLNHLEMHVKKLALDASLNVASVMLISASKKQNVDKVLEKVKKIRYKKDRKTTNFDDCYVMGCASVGKSTFINALLKITNQIKKDLITTSDEFNTTLDFIKINLDRKNYIIDTPGIINPNSFGAYLLPDSVKKITPHKYIKPRTYQLNPDQTIFIGGLARLDFVEGEKISVSTYVSNDLYVHRTKTVNAEEVFVKNVGKLLNPPVTEKEIELLSDTKVVEFKIESGAYDLEIPGVGFIHLTGTNVLVNVTVYKEIEVKMVKSFIC